MWKGLQRACIFYLDLPVQSVKLFSVCPLRLIWCLINTILYIGACLRQNQNKCTYLRGVLSYGKLLILVMTGAMYPWVAMDYDAGFTLLQDCAAAEERMIFLSQIRCIPEHILLLSLGKFYGFLRHFNRWMQSMVNLGKSAGRGLECLYVYS